MLGFRKIRQLLAMSAVLIFSYGPVNSPDDKNASSQPALQSGTEEDQSVSDKCMPLHLWPLENHLSMI